MSYLDIPKEDRTKIALTAIELSNKAEAARMWLTTRHIVARCVQEYELELKGVQEVPVEAVVVIQGEPEPLPAYKDVEPISEQELRRLVNLDKAVARVYVNKAQSAKSRGIPFLMRYEFVRGLFSNPLCAYTGQKMGEDATFERIDPTAGYLEDNVVLVTAVANSAKSRLDQFIHDPQLTMPQKRAILERVLAKVNWEQ